MFILWFTLRQIVVSLGKIYVAHFLGDFEKFFKRLKALRFYATFFFLWCKDEHIYAKFNYHMLLDCSRVVAKFMIRWLRCTLKQPRSLNYLEMTGHDQSLFIITNIGQVTIFVWHIINGNDYIHRYWYYGN